jgi:integrase
MKKREGIKLNKAGLAKCVLADGKSDDIWFDLDLAGFGVRVRAGGKRTWIYQYKIGEKHRRLTLGSVDAVTPEKARKAAELEHAKVMLGDDPQGTKAKKRAEAVVTLGAVIPQFLEHKRESRRARTVEELERYLTQHFKPLHGLQVDKIERETIATRLTGIEKKSGKTARARARAALSSFYAWAMTEGIAKRDYNPVAGTRQVELGDGPDRVLEDDELAAIWNGAREDDFGRIVRLAILLGQRRSEISSLPWGELDLEARVWTLPAERSKNRRAHQIPLSGPALAILAGIERRVGRDLVFGEGERGFSGWSAAKKRLDARIAEARGAPLEPWSLHDLRRTFSTRLNDMGVAPHVVEALLNHVSSAESGKRGVAGTYNRALYLKEKATALELWSDAVRVLVEGGERKIVTFMSR